jgi:hypothetical protein
MLQAILIAYQWPARLDRKLVHPGNGRSIAILSRPETELPPGNALKLKLDLP